MKKILVGVDGSEEALRAVDLAAELARAQKASLKLAYVIMPLAFPPNTYGTLLDAITVEEQREAERSLQQAEQRAKRTVDSVEVQTLRGSPAEVLAELAKAPDVQMIVVGTHGRGAVSRFLLGSVSNRLVHICERPVLVQR
jgi:nucleotide-binding universal stress UspA family protein